MDHTIANIVGNNIKRLRIKKNWSQSDLAKKIGAPAQLISKYERGGHTPGSAKLNQLAQALDVNVSELTRAEGEPRTVNEAGPAYDPIPRLSPQQIEMAKTLSKLSEEEQDEIIRKMKDEIIEMLTLLIRAAERVYRPVLLLCYYGGLRKTEALTIQGRKINFAHGYMVVRGKGNKERIVPMFRKLRVHLRRRYQKGYLFTNPATGRPYVDMKRALDRAAKKSGIEQHVYLHLLRHGFGTHSIMSGIGLRSVQMIMGHSSAQVTEIYTTLAGQFLSHELDKFGGDHGAGHNGKPLKKLTKSAA